MNVYEIVTSKIIETMKSGIIPWRRPWKDCERPKNLLTGKSYSGVNWMLLSSRQIANPYWLTYKQAKDLGGNVKKGEHGTMVVFYKSIEVEHQKADGTNTIDTFPVLRYYTVFNLSQTEGIPVTKIPPVESRPINPIETAEKIIAEIPNRPAIVSEREGCFYSLTKDIINMVPKDRFNSSEEFYSTLFHELTHSTGHLSRLGRHQDKSYEMHRYGDENYSREELVAELGSAFLMSTARLDADDTLHNHAGYIQGWLKALDNDPRMIVVASSQAQKAANYLLHLG